MREAPRGGDPRGVEDWARAVGGECVYYLADAEDAESVRVAEQGGFRLVDVRITRVCGIPGVAGELPSGIEPGRPEDLPTLREIARVSHVDTRFYHDGNFGDERCAALYETWIERSLAGSTDAVLVARSTGKAAGYLACKVADDGIGAVELFAVAPDRRGEGWGEQLLRGALTWLAGRGCREAQMVTQGRNVRAARLYGRCGFLTTAVELWYHRWSAGDAGEAA